MLGVLLLGCTASDAGHGRSNDEQNNPRQDEDSNKAPAQPKVPAHLLSVKLLNLSKTSSSIDFQVFVDDDLIWTGDAEYRNGRNMLKQQIRIPEGKHKLSVKSSKGSADAIVDFELESPLAIRIHYKTDPASSEASPSFFIDLPARSH